MILPVIIANGEWRSKMRLKTYGGFRGISTGSMYFDTLMYMLEKHNILSSSLIWWNIQATRFIPVFRTKKIANEFWKFVQLNDYKERKLEDDITVQYLDVYIYSRVAVSPRRGNMDLWTYEKASRTLTNVLANISAKSKIIFPLTGSVLLTRDTFDLLIDAIMTLDNLLYGNDAPDYKKELELYHNTTRDVPVSHVLIKPVNFQQKVTIENINEANKQNLEESLRAWSIATLQSFKHIS